MLVDDTWSKSKEICPFCGNKFICWKKPQYDRFRKEESMICPYCIKTIKVSDEYDFYTEAIWNM